ncbi:hypothetical protein [Streptomyces sp. NBC_01304]|uniref:hypothetical protein n=1 Tax=Streptomyces sp. NBC_01304 TaxID=2903818 RepID=UPI002E0F3AFF|nr:hypothetical protein OG430_02085 [Streptomyces sp. NBC_01304]
MGIFSRSKGSKRLLVVKGGRVKHVPTELWGMNLVQEISRLLRSESITSTRLGTVTLWHVAGDGTPNPGASRLMAEHGFQPVNGAAVVSGEMIGADSFPLDVAVAEELALRLEP